MSAVKPVAVLSTPVVLTRSAKAPLAVFSLPVGLVKSAQTPLAVLSEPVILLRSVKAPLAVLSEPVVLLFRALAPVAVFSLPVVLLMSASSPRNVLPVMRSQPSWQTARTFGENAKQASASGMRNKVRRKGECLIEFRAIGVVVFDLNKFMVLCSVLSWLTQRLLRRSEEHTSELQSPDHLVCRLLLEKKKRR